MEYLVYFAIGFGVASHAHRNNKDSSFSSGLFFILFWPTLLGWALASALDLMEDKGI